MRGETIRVNADNSMEILEESKELNQYCYFCDFSEIRPHQHHIIRKSDGGKDVFNNILPLCANHHELIHRRIYVLAFNPKQRLYYLKRVQDSKIISPTERQKKHKRDLPLSSINYSHNLIVEGNINNGKAVVKIKDFYKNHRKKQKKRLKDLSKGI